MARRAAFGYAMVLPPPATQALGDAADKIGPQHRPWPEQIQ